MTWSFEKDWYYSFPHRNQCKNVSKAISSLPSNPSLLPYTSLLSKGVSGSSIILVTSGYDPSPTSTASHSAQDQITQGVELGAYLTICPSGFSDSYFKESSVIINRQTNIIRTWRVSNLQYNRQSDEIQAAVSINIFLKGLVF